MIHRSRTRTVQDATVRLAAYPRSSPAGASRRSGWSVQQPRRRAASSAISKPRPSYPSNRKPGSGFESLNEPAFTAIASALSAKDSYTWAHSKRVGAYASGIARLMGVKGDRIAQIRFAGELHDVGKIGVPGKLLRKCGSLTANEYRQVMEHPVMGEQIIRPLLPDGHLILGAVRWHHERYDGRGGPDCLTAEEIPLAARIVAVADAFDAMTSTRPYRSPLPLDVALAELDENAGSQFDPECVRALHRLYPVSSPVGSLHVAVPA